MWWDFISPFTTVNLYYSVGVDRIPFVWVNSNAKETGVSLKHGVDNVKTWIDDEKCNSLPIVCSL